jgi:hypothetical protein
MNYDEVEARYIGGYVIWLRFRDNTSGEIDLEKELYGPVFEPLRDPAGFNQFYVHPEFHPHLAHGRGPGAGVLA